MSVARRGFLAIVAGVCLWPVKWLLSSADGGEPVLHQQSAVVDLFCSERGPAIPLVEEELARMLAAWDGACLGPAVLVVPPALSSEVLAAVGVQHDGSGRRNIHVSIDPYCPPGKMYLYPKATWGTRRQWGRTDG